MLPKLKKEAVSEVLLRRMKKPPLDKNSLRNKLLDRIKLLLLNKLQYSPKQKENSELDIDRICEKTKKAMEKYKILEILKS